MKYKIVRAWLLTI